MPKARCTLCYFYKNGVQGFLTISMSHFVGTILGWVDNGFSSIFAHLTNQDTRLFISHHSGGVIPYPFPKDLHFIDDSIFTQYFGSSTVMKLNVLELKSPRIEGDQFRATISGRPGLQVEVQGSNDLTNWRTSETVVIQSPPVSFTAEPYRFWRLKRVPTEAE